MAPTCLLLLATLGCAQARAATGQISRLTDVSFSSLNPLMAATSAQSVCAYSTAMSGAYSIRGTGSGPGGAFQLSAGGNLYLAYGVQWSSRSGATTGSSMTAGVDLTGQTTSAALNCTLANSASLIITLAAADLQSAVSGVSYTGTLTLLLTPQ